MILAFPIRANDDERFRLKAPALTAHWKSPGRRCDLRAVAARAIDAYMAEYETLHARWFLQRMVEDEAMAPGASEEPDREWLDDPVQSYVNAHQEFSALWIFSSCSAKVGPPFISAPKILSN
jgi:hypothetical protein